jgi:single-stranded DNA-specific DHH superfamily exonuclease
VETIAWLREHDVDVIVLDHHQVSNPAPAAVALVNPQLTSSSEIANRKSQIVNSQGRVSTWRK